MPGIGSGIDRLCSVSVMKPLLNNTQQRLDECASGSIRVQLLNCCKFAAELAMYKLQKVGYTKLTKKKAI